MCSIAVMVIVINVSSNVLVSGISAAASSDVIVVVVLVIEFG